jgi:hypothetical protein
MILLAQLDLPPLLIGIAFIVAGLLFLSTLRPGSRRHVTWDIAGPRMSRAGVIVFASVAILLGIATSIAAFGAPWVEPALWAVLIIGPVLMFLCVLGGRSTRHPK